MLGYEARFCGRVPPPVITSSANILLVRFITNNAISGAGFNATYTYENGKYVFNEKKVREKSRECHNHKPQSFPDPKRK